MLLGIVLGAAANTFMTITLGIALAEALNHHFPVETFLLFLLTMVSVLVSRRITFIRTANWLADFNFTIRQQLLGRLRNIELLDFEQMQPGEIYHSIGADCRQVGETAEILANMLYMGTLVVITLGYLAWLSLEIVSVAMLVLIIMGVAYLSSLLNVQQAVADAQQAEGRLFRAANHLLSGFKELALNQAKSHAFFSEAVVAQAETLQARKVQQGRRYALNYMIFDTTSLLLASLTLGLMPLYQQVTPDTVVRALPVLLFMPLGSIFRDMPVVLRASNALERLSRVEAKLAQASQETLSISPELPSPEPPGFRSLSLQQASFRYHQVDGQPGFGIGPLSLHIPAGTITFIVGGNGSGKSTLMKLLTGLYPPSSGHVLLNGAPVAMPDLRQLFSAIYTDFHLFDRLYGLENVDPATVNQLLAEFGLDDKTHYGENGFSALDLSPGQRKRVAMVVSLLEDAPIYVLDEWAADQDQVFREYFYRQLLPTLKARGKTVIAVSHDDRYFDVPDQLIRLEFGRQVSA